MLDHVLDPWAIPGHLATFSTGWPLWFDYILNYNLQYLTESFMSECCPRCKAHALDVDPIEGWLVCHACGHLPSEASENLQSFEGSYVEYGTRVDEQGHGRGAASHMHGHGAFNLGVGRESDSHESRLRHWRMIEDRIQAMGSQLRLPASVAEDACLLLDEYRKTGRDLEDDSLPSIASASAAEPSIEGPTRHVSPVTSGLIGAGLYAAARMTGNLGLIIQEVAQAAQVMGLDS